MAVKLMLTCCAGYCRRQCFPALQDGMMKNKSTYEIMSPEYIGLTRADESGIVLGEMHYSVRPPLQHKFKGR